MLKSLTKVAKLLFLLNSVNVAVTLQYYCDILGMFHVIWVLAHTFVSFSCRDESSNVAIIREVYDSENAHETFEYELERALESECSLIVIEPSKLGDETSRWIAVGNCLHKTAALSGLAAIATGLSNLYKKSSHTHYYSCYYREMFRIFNFRLECISIAYCFLFPISIKNKENYKHYIHQA